MIPSLLQALGAAFNLLRTDFLIMVPYFVLFLIVQTSSSFLTASFSKDSVVLLLVVFIGAGVVLDTLVKVVTLSFFHQLYHKKTLSLGEALRRLSARFFPLLFSTLGILLPIVGCLAYLITQKGEPSGLDAAVNLLLIFVGVYLGIVSQFLPVFSVLEQQSVLQSIVSSFHFVKVEFRFVLRYFAVILGIGFVFLVLTASFVSVPILGKAVFEAFFQGMSYTLMYGLLVVAYSQLKELRQGTLVDCTVDDNHPELDS